MFEFNIKDVKEDRKLIICLRKIFSKKREETFILPKKGESVILLFSGGLDSVALFNYLCSVYEAIVYPIYVRSNLFDNAQFKSAKFFVNFFKRKYKKLVKDLTVVNQSFNFSFSSLTNLNRKFIKLLLNNLVKLNNSDEYLPIIISNPARLGFYGFIAYEYLLKIRYHNNASIKTILVGIVPEDRILRESNISVLLSINLTFCEILNDYSIQFYAPIDKKVNFFLQKEVLVKKAIQDCVPLYKSFSCVKNVWFHCGKCFNCLSRKKIFSILNYNDKTYYLSNSRFYNKTIKLLRCILKKNH
ncbi:MAG: hypothetical protein KatS3mg090_0540 [Patescibacteria group bacterium]|nr:MAG: hypothetical protein KatS3mg090_0540 [Patescibacteria group bacterium]